MQGVRFQYPVQGGEAGVPIMDQIPARPPPILYDHREVPGLLRDPGRMGLRGAASQPDSTTAQVEEEQDIKSNQSTQGPDLFSKEIRRPSDLQVGVQELLPRRAFAIGDRRQAVTPEHVPYVAGAGIVAEFLELPGETFVTPRVVFSGETNNQGFGVLRFARSSGLCRRVVVGPFLLLLAAVPAQKSFGFGDGNDLGKPSLDGQAKLDENQPVGFGEGHAGGEFAAEDSVFLAQKIILQSEVAAEKLVNFGDQGVGRNLGAGAHRLDSIAASAIRANSKGILPSVIGADEFLHRTGFLKLCKGGWSSIEGKTGAVHYSRGAAEFN